MFVLRESLLECSFCQSDVVLRSIVCCDSGVVSASVALVLGIRFGVDAGYFLVVLVYYRLHIVHTTVADLDVVFVKKAVIFIFVFGNVLRLV